MATRKIRLPAVQHKMGECSASTVWRRVQDGTLPKPHKIGGMTVWNENEVDERLGLGTRDEPEAA